MCPCVSQTYSNLAAFTFFARSHPGDVCGSNGLPLTPNSIAILGRSQMLKSLEHPNLCEYLDIIRGKHERTIVVSEYIGTPLSQKKYEHSETTILKIFYQITVGLEVIHSCGFVNNNLEPAHILLDETNNVKLFNYGCHYMTKGGEYVSFPIGNVRYMSPERLLGSKDNLKSDIWSLGIIITELIFECILWPILNNSQVMRKILSFCNTKNVLEKIARENNCLDKYESLTPDLCELLQSCLSISPSERLSTENILKHRLFQDDLYNFVYRPSAPPAQLLMRLPLKHIYYLWQLAGGDIQMELKKEGLIKNEAPILTMPKLILLDGQTVGPPRSQTYMVDPRIVILSLTNLTDRLAHVSKQSYYPLIHSPKFALTYGEQMKSLPLVIRERDIEYQFHRVMLFSRMLKGYPFTRELIVNESKIDIPPLLRGQVWAALLGVLENGLYAKIDKVTPTSTDRQIDVDIPRCHQYDELLSSPEGHKKLKRLLKAWVTSHPQYVYWQGLDSLTAPFLYLNFNNEERAFLSLYKFIPKYLHWFFLRDNSAVIKEYLNKFLQLTAFHEPVLANHLSGIHFIPELFAIPWFLTMFSHVFPLHKIIHLWDKLLLGDNSYPLFIGISVLKQLKTTLLDSGFNECILLFSDLPDIVMETCVIESQKMYDATPKSVSYRKHVLREIETEAFDINDVELQDLLTERCSRISASDLIKLLDEHDSIVAIDLRSSLDFKRAHIKGSINIPFTSVSLGDVRLESLNVQHLDAKLDGKIVVVLSTHHENAVLFSNFLLDCAVARVCVLHNGFNILHSVIPSILVSG